MRSAAHCHGQIQLPTWTLNNLKSFNTTILILSVKFRALFLLCLIRESLSWHRLLVSYEKSLVNKKPRCMRTGFNWAYNINILPVRAAAASSGFQAFLRVDEILKGQLPVESSQPGSNSRNRMVRQVGFVTHVNLNALDPKSIMRYWTSSCHWLALSAILQR